MSEKDGLCDLESVISVASKSLKKNGYLALEFGQNQADLVSDLLSAHFTAEIISDQYLVRRFALAVRK